MADDDDNKSNEPKIGRATRIVCLLLVAAFLVWTFVSSQFDGDDASSQGLATHHPIVIKPMHDPMDAIPLSRLTGSLHSG